MFRGLRIFLSPYRASLVLAAITIVGLLCVINRGFDVTDEAMYIYDMKYPGPNSGTHINFIVGRIGAVFDNNIVVWRVIALLVLAGASIIFATGIWRFCLRLGLINSCSIRSPEADRIGFSALVLTGSLGYFGFGPPTLSSNTVAAGGMLAALGALSWAITTSSFASRLSWAAFAALCAVLMEAARISAATAYLLALLPLMWLSAELIGWRATVIVAGIHASLSLIWLAIIATGFSIDTWAVTQLMLHTGASSKSSYGFTVLLQQHLQDTANFVEQSLRLGGQVVGAGLVTGTVFFSSRSLYNSSPLSLQKMIQAVGSSTAMLAALLPLWPLYHYLAGLDSIVGAAAADCRIIEMIVCEGPNSGLDGHPFMYVVGAQIIAGAALLICDFLAATIATQVRYPSNARAILRWSALLVFLIGATTIASVGTNTGLLYHIAVSMGPLLAAGFIAVGLLPLRALRITSGVMPLLVFCFVVLIAVSIAHNRLFFPYRIEGTIFSQSVRLNAPPELKGLRTTYKLSTIIAGIKASLEKAGFDRRHDIVVAPYNMPGLIVAIEARAFGFAWLSNGPAAEELNCYRFEHEPTDVKAIGRVFLILNSNPSAELKECLKARAINFDNSEVLATLPVDSMRTLTIAIVKTP